MIRSSHSCNSLFCFICKKMFNIISQYTSGQFKWLCNCVSPYCIQVQYNRHYFSEQKKESFIIIAVVNNSGYLKVWAHNAEKLNCKMHHNIWEIPDKKRSRAEVKLQSPTNQLRNQDQDPDDHITV